MAVCLALSFLTHLVLMAVAALIPWTPRQPESVMVVDLADLPRPSDFLPPKPGIIRREPPPRSRPARVMEGRVPDLPVDPALPPEEILPALRPKDPARSAPPEKPAAAARAAAEKPAPAAKAPPSPPEEPGEQGGSGKPIKETIPSLGKMVLAMGERGSRGTGNSSGSAVGTRGKAVEKGGIVEEGGSGATLTALNAPEFQYISYFAGIKRKIELVWGYPAAAAGIQGDVVIDFVIARSGRLDSVTLVQGSGHKVLDDEALGAIRKASPYDPIPSRYRIPNLQIRAHFLYTVTQTRILR